jgi:hypothetical protein
VNAEAEHVQASRLWAGIMITPDLDTCRSLLLGRKILAGRLDGEVLRRALRGAPLPHAESYLEITTEMLDAVAEAGPLTLKGPRP